MAIFDDFDFSSPKHTLMSFLSTGHAYFPLILLFSTFCNLFRNCVLVCLQLEGRLLPTEKIKFRGRNTVDAGREADWGRAQTRSEVISAVSSSCLYKWDHCLGYGSTTTAGLVVPILRYHFSVFSIS